MYLLVCLFNLLKINVGLEKHSFLIWMLSSYLLFPPVCQFELKLPVVTNMSRHAKFLNNVLKISDSIMKFIQNRV